MTITSHRWRPTSSKWERSWPSLWTYCGTSLSMLLTVLPTTKLNFAMKLTTRRHKAQDWALQSFCSRKALKVLSKHTSSWRKRTHKKNLSTQNPNSLLFCHISNATCLSWDKSTNSLQLSPSCSSTSARWTCVLWRRMLCQQSHVLSSSILSRTTARLTSRLHL